MRWIRTVADEVLGLFVDDGTFTVAILAWLLLVWLAMSQLRIAPGWGAALFVFGLGAIFLESVARRARTDP